MSRTYGYGDIWINGVEVTNETCMYYIKREPLLFIIIILFFVEQKREKLEGMASQMNSILKYLIVLKC